MKVKTLRSTITTVTRIYDTYMTLTILLTSVQQVYFAKCNLNNARKVDYVSCSHAKVSNEFLTFRFVLSVVAPTQTVCAFFHNSRFQPFLHTMTKREFCLASFFRLSSFVGGKIESERCEREGRKETNGP